MGRVRHASGVGAGVVRGGWQGVGNCGLLAPSNTGAKCTHQLGGAQRSRNKGAGAPRQAGAKTMCVGGVRRAGGVGAGVVGAAGGGKGVGGWCGGSPCTQSTQGWCVAHQIAAKPRSVVKVNAASCALPWRAGRWGWRACACKAGVAPRRGQVLVSPLATPCARATQIFIFLVFYVFVHASATQGVGWCGWWCVNCTTVALVGVRERDEVWWVRE